MDIFPKSVNDLIEVLSEIPGIGPKTAERMAFYITISKNSIIDKLLYSLSKVKEEVKICSECGMVSDTDPCRICSSPSRDSSIVCVVEKPNDVITIEKTGEFNGVYHVLGGVISPVEGVGPSDLSIDKLLSRIVKNKVREIFLALDPDTEGETTSSYIISLVKQKGIDVVFTSIAKGIPMGGNIEYSDLLTLSKAIKNRNRID